MKGEVQAQAVRLDKWLWAARFYKTRALAKAMIEGGKVHYNQSRAKPNKTVQIGAVIRLRQGNDEKEVRVLGLSDKRGGAVVAQTLYEETAASVEKRVQMALARKSLSLALPHPERRPTKKERRDLQKFKQDCNAQF